MAASALLAATLGGCNCAETRSEESEIMHEDAKVANCVHTPPTHDSKLELTAFGVGMMGQSYSGNTGLRVGDNYQISQIDVPDKYAVVFECPHGGFISQGIDLRHQTLYDKLKPHVGQPVDVTFRELFRVTYQDLDKDGKKEVTSRVLVGYDFLDAVVK